MCEPCPRRRQRITVLPVCAPGDLYVAGEFEQTLRLGEAVLEAQVVPGFDLFGAKYAAATITADDTPAQVRRSPAYPNPFRETTIIAYKVPEAGPVRLAVYGAPGRLRCAWA